MIGLIFGETNFPIQILKKIRTRHLKYLIIDLTKKRKFKNDIHSHAVSIGQLGKIIKILKENSCQKVLFAGKVKKPNFSKLRLDFKGIYYIPRIIRSSKLGDAAILKEIIKILEQEKIRTISSLTFNPELTLKKGCYTKIKPNNEDNADIKKAITKVRSEGRLQSITQGKLRKYVSKNNQILIDGAHNPLAATAVKKYLETLNKNKKIFMVLGMMANKEHKEFIKIFKNKIHAIITLNIPNQINFIKKEKLSKIAQSCGVPSKTADSIESALNDIAKENDRAIIFCTGSLYFAGEILNLN